MSDFNSVIPTGVKPANFNVRYRAAPNAALAWGLENHVPVKVFENFDGGGFNHYICEFQTLGDACVFREHFGIKEKDTLWIEDVDGHVHYLNAPEMIRPPSSVDAPPNEAAKSAPYVVSLQRPNWVPITLDQLGLSRQEMETFAEGSRILYQQDGTKPGPDSAPASPTLP